MITYISLHKHWCHGVRLYTCDAIVIGVMLLYFPKIIQALPLLDTNTNVTERGAIIDCLRISDMLPFL